MRKQGTKTRIHRVVDSAHCPNCGAPESDVASNACEFCDSVLNDGSYDWVLSECHNRHTAAARAWLSRAASGPVHDRKEEAAEPSYADLMAWATKIFVADKILDKDEREMMVHLARKQGMSKSMLLDLIERVRKGDLDVPAPSTPSGSEVWLGMMVDLALLDENIQPGERELLGNLGDHVGLKPGQVDLLIDKRRSKRIRESNFLDALVEDGVDL